MTISPQKDYVEKETQWSFAKFVKYRTEQNLQIRTMVQRGSYFDIELLKTKDVNLK